MRDPWRELFTKRQHVFFYAAVLGLAAISCGLGYIIFVYAWEAFGR